MIFTNNEPPLKKNEDTLFGFEIWWVCRNVHDLYLVLFKTKRLILKSL